MNLNKRLSKEDREEFENTVDDYMCDTNFLRDNNLPVNPKREIVKKALYKIMYQ